MLSVEARRTPCQRAGLWLLGHHVEGASALRLRTVEGTCVTAYRQDLKCWGESYCSARERKQLIGISLPWLPCPQVMIIRTLRYFKTGSQASSDISKHYRSQSRSASCWHYSKSAVSIFTGHRSNQELAQRAMSFAAATIV